jgi:hypothetical protein
MGMKQCKECKGEVSTKAKTCPKCGAPAPSGSLLLKIGGVMLFMATCTALAGRSGANGSSSTASAASVAGTPAAAAKPAKVVTPPVEVTAMALWRAYDSNEVAADNAYKDRDLLVTGTLSSIDKDFLDNVILDLKSPNEFMNVKAKLEDSEKSKAAGLSKGAKVVVLCTGAGRMVGSPYLKDCTIKG